MHKYARQVLKNYTETDRMSTSSKLTQFVAEAKRKEQSLISYQMICILNTYDTKAKSENKTQKKRVEKKLS